MISGSAGSTAHSAGCCSQKGTHAAKAGADWVVASRGAAAAEVSDAQTSAMSAKYRRASDIVFPAEGGGCSSECRFRRAHEVARHRIYKLGDLLLMVLRLRGIACPHHPPEGQGSPKSPGDLNPGFRASESFRPRTPLGSRPCCHSADRNRRPEMTELILPFARPLAGGAARSIAGMVAKAFVEVRKQLANRATVAELRSLDDRTLSDIGLHRSEIDSIAWVGFDRIRGR